MIIKSYETNKLDINKYNFILLHGDNEGAKKELILSTISANKDKKVINYEEKQILENGRSTPGEKQKNELPMDGSQWQQINAITGT